MNCKRERRRKLHRRCSSTPSEPSTESTDPRRSSLASLALRESLQHLGRTLNHPLRQFQSRSVRQFRVDMPDHLPLRTVVDRLAVGECRRETREVGKGGRVDSKDVSVKSTQRIRVDFRDVDESFIAVCRGSAGALHGVVTTHSSSSSNPSAFRTRVCSLLALPFSSFLFSCPAAHLSAIACIPFHPGPPISSRCCVTIDFPLA